MNGEDAVRQIAAETGGSIDEMVRLPDGSGFAIMSFPLPKDHWSVINPDDSNVPPMGLRLGTDNPRHNELVEKLRAAGRYAYRSATMNGKDTDLDPDALIQNLVVGLFGYHTADGLSSDDWANPSPIPPREESRR